MIEKLNNGMVARICCLLTIDSGCRSAHASFPLPISSAIWTGLLFSIRLPGDEIKRMGRAPL